MNNRVKVIKLKNYIPHTSFKKKYISNITPKPNYTYSNKLQDIFKKYNKTIKKFIISIFHYNFFIINFR